MEFESLSFPRHLSPTENRKIAGGEPHVFARREALDRIWRFFRSCASCGFPAWPVPHSSLTTISLFCTHCEEALASIQNRGEKLQQAGYPFEVSALFCWTPLTDPLVRPLLYALKGGWQVAAMREFARRLSFENSSKTKGQRLLFVHPPARAGRSRFDHAALLAHCLAHEWNGRVWQGLVRPHSRLSLFQHLRVAIQSRDGQKHQTRRERAQLRFEGTMGCPLEEFDRIIFVDDVITTGATAMAAYMALGDPESFEVWALAARPQLAGSRPI